MKAEINYVVEQLTDAYTGDPWFGRAAKVLLNEVDEHTAFEKLNHQHSILELVWHMVNWREFTIHCLTRRGDIQLGQFEKMDWRELDHTDHSLWQAGLKKLDETQDNLLRVLLQQDDAILGQNVPGRNYNYRKLIHGIIQHDIYHLGQIAFITKLVNQS